MDISRLTDLKTDSVTTSFRAAAVAVQRILPRGLEGRMVGQPQVVVGGEVQDLPPVQAHGGALLAVHHLVVAGGVWRGRSV